MDWEQEFKYLEPAHTRPSANDLYNSLRTSGMDKVQASAIAELVCIMFNRIAAIESFVAMASELAQRLPDADGR